MGGRDPLSDPAPLIRRVYSYAAYHVGAGAAAEDVTGETMERAVRYRDSYDPRKGAPAAWLLGIARRVIADRRQQVLVAEPPEREDVSDMEGAVVERVTLEGALAGLGERDRDLLTLRYAGDLSARQIAAVLDMDTHAVEVALGRALARLRDVLQDSPAARRDVV